MKHLSFCLALLGSASVSAQGLQVQLQWQHIDGVHEALSSGETLGDFDGDGTVEIAILGGAQPGSMSDGTDVGIAGHDAVDGWRWEQMLHLAGSLAPPLLTLPHPDGDRLLGLRTGSGLPNALVRYGGTPLRLIDALPVPDTAGVLAAGDLDGDGDADVIERVAGFGIDRIAARDIESGVVTWTQDVFRAPNVFFNVALAQLDADAALEVVVNGAPGMVFDGVLGAVEWSHAGGFSSHVRAGNFDSDPATEFVSAGFDSPDATVFDAAPYAPGATVAMDCCKGIGALAVADVDADGIDEWVVASGGLFVVEPLTGVSTAIVLPSLAKRSLKVGQLDDDPAPEIVINGYGGVYPRLRVIDGSGTFETEFDSWADRAPGYPMVIGDLEGNGGEQIAYVGMNGQAYGLAGDDTIILRIRDAATGELLRTAPVPEFLGSGPPLEMMIAAAQLDADPALELAIAPFRGNGSRAVVLDSVDFSRMYTLEEPSLSFSARALEFADIDADGDIELVVLGMGLRVQVHAAATGTLLWSTPEPEFHDGGEMVVRNVDADPALEVLVHNGRDVLAWDGATQALDWTIDGGFLASGERFVVFDRAGACRVGLYGNWQYREHACSAGSAAGEVVPDAAATRILPVVLDDTGLLASAGRLVRFDTTTGAMQRLSDDLGVNAGLVVDSILVPEPGRVFVGNNGVIRRFALVDSDVFADGFE